MIIKYIWKRGKDSGTNNAIDSLYENLFGYKKQGHLLDAPAT